MHQKAGITNGYCTSASEYSIAIGYCANAHSNNRYDTGIAIGGWSNAYYESINIGCGNKCTYSGPDSYYDGIVIGYNNCPQTYRETEYYYAQKNIILGYNNDIIEAKNNIIIGQNNHASNRYIGESKNIILGNNNSAAPHNGSIIMIGNYIYAGSVSSEGGNNIHAVFSNGYATNNKYYQFYFGLNNESYNPVLGVIVYDINGNKIDSECYQIDLASLGTNSYNNITLGINN